LTAPTVGGTPATAPSGPITDFFDIVFEWLAGGSVFNGSTFAATTDYDARITLTPKATYGLKVDNLPTTFYVLGASATRTAGTITIDFPALP
jgi:hypothetical protein